MKLITILLFALISLPAAAGLIRHDTPDSSYTNYARDAAFNSVGLILGNASDASYSCSGTVINKNWVLTAAHCANNAQALSFYLQDQNGWRFYEVNSWVTHDNYDEEDKYSGWDIGLLYINTDLDVAPAQLYTGSEEWLTMSTSVGFGYTGNGETGVEGIDYLGRAGTNTIDDVWSIDGGARILWSDFDHPTDPSYNVIEYSDMEYDDLASALEFMIAPGDSGGGLFIQENGQNYLAGIHSFMMDYSGNGDFGYGDIYGSTRVSSFIGWIDNIINPYPVSEPSSIFLLLTALAAVGWRRNKGSGINIINNIESKKNPEFTPNRPCCTSYGG
jgi:hypothetical protein